MMLVYSRVLTRVRAMRSLPVESRGWVRTVVNLGEGIKREKVCFEEGEELTA